MPALSFATYDVFSDTRFAGNPLAVVFDADGLDDAAMQNIAREFNLSETTFVRRAKNTHHSAEVRIFTPGKELPFAGHPTIGSAIAIAERAHGARDPRDVLLVLEEKVGPVRCGVKLGAGASFAEFDAPKLSQEIGRGATDSAAAAALGLNVSDIGFDRHIPSLFSAGVPFAFAPLASLDALARARPTESFNAEAMGAGEVYLYARAPAHEAHAFRARMFAPAFGIMEDPATGSAAAAFAGVAHKFEPLDEGWTQMPILQGVEMGRPSLIGLEIEIAEGKLSAARISGNAVKVSEGTISV
ncbi:MAG TPA: PhzF family phenazine biosynthesis protein [Caulobacterales bacterium]|nr:PhzF family phenazine biosynthesis protein [Caulobacterales bacterium]